MKKLIILLSLLVLNDTKNNIYCDIKGNVKNPGVYEIKENYTIQNIIDDAGGLKKNSYTKNINLSKKVTDEMVIYIFNKSEIEEATKINECICKPTYKYVECKTKEENTTTKIVTTTRKNTENNTATIEDLPKETTTSNITTTEKISTTSKPTTLKTPTTTNITTKIEEIIININTATIEELSTLKGLGEKKAQNIIDYRTLNGSFNTIEEIMNVNGIGKSTFEKIKEFIKV